MQGSEQPWFSTIAATLQRVSNATHVHHSDKANKANNVSKCFVQGSRAAPLL
ncbi:MAG: hypothetical protein IPJ94_17615 [Chloroflexi bacterium]|nr:hypothetical protein [Chloroflexota bacterium]